MQLHIAPRHQATCKVKAVVPNQNPNPNPKTLFLHYNQIMNPKRSFDYNVS